MSLLTRFAIVLTLAFTGAFGSIAHGAVVSEGERQIVAEFTGAAQAQYSEVVKRFETIGGSDLQRKALLVNLVMMAAMVDESFEKVVAKLLAMNEVELKSILPELEQQIKGMKIPTGKTVEAYLEETLLLMAETIKKEGRR